MRSNYKYTLTELLSVTDSSSVCVIFYENILDLVHHKHELKMVTDLIGVDYLQADISKRVNVSKEVGLPDDARKEIASHFKDVYRYIADYYGDRLPARWQETMALI